MAEPGPRIAAGLTLYRADWPIFEALLDRMYEEAAAIFVVVDGPVGEAIEPAQLARLQARKGITILPLRANAGIASGLNRLVDAACREGFERLVLFDQDSEAEAGLVQRLNEALSQLKKNGHRPAAIGPKPTPAPGSQTRAPRYRHRGERMGELAGVDFVIVSGSVLDLGVAEKVGPFDEALGMDGVDVEWGFRAWAKGFSIFVHDGATLAHRVGTGLVRVGPVVFPRQSQARMENYVRSQMMFQRMRHVPLRWKLRSLAYVPVQCVVFAVESGRPFPVLTRLLRAATSFSIARPSRDRRP